MSDGNKSVNLLETFKYLHNGLPCIPLWRLVQLLCIVGVNALYNYEKDQIEYIKGENNSIPDFLTREFL